MKIYVPLSKTMLTAALIVDIDTFGKLILNNNQSKFSN